MNFNNDAVEHQILADTKEMIGVDQSKVLLLYTGGTIGMKNTKHGYVPVTFS
jgi:lysophospholipase